MFYWAQRGLADGEQYGLWTAWYIHATGGKRTYGYCFCIRSCHKPDELWPMEPGSSASKLTLLVNEYRNNIIYDAYFEVNTDFECASIATLASSASHSTSPLGLGTTYFTKKTVLKPSVNLVSYHRVRIKSTTALPGPPGNAQAFASLFEFRRKTIWFVQLFGFIDGCNLQWYLNRRRERERCLT